MSERDEKNVADAFGRICTCEHRARKHGSCGCSDGREIGEQGYAVYPCPCLWTGLVQDDGVRFRTEVAALRDRAERAERALAAEWERAYRAGLEAVCRILDRRAREPGLIAVCDTMADAASEGRALPVPPRPEEGKT